MRATPALDVYLALAGLRTQVRAHLAALRRLDAMSGLSVARIDGYYSKALDTGLLRLRFVRPQTWQLSELIVWADCEGLQLVEPGSLAPERCREFYAHYLPRFHLVASECSCPELALVEIAEARAPKKRRGGRAVSGVLGDRGSTAASGTLPRRPPSHA